MEWLFNQVYYSNSIVAGGLQVQSYSTLLTPSTSLTILFDINSRTSYGILPVFADIKSVVITALKAIA